MFSSLPSDVHNLIYSSLSFKDIGIMHQVSKAQNTTITNSLSEQKRREQIFKDRFGAFASYENTQDIWNRTARRYNRLKKLSQANPTFILKFDVDGMPILVKPTNEPEKTSWRENIKVKYFQWLVKSPDKSVDIEMQKIFNEHAIVLKDLFTRPLEEIAPLQDYRDRMIRLQIIREERAFLLMLLGSHEIREKNKVALSNYWTTNSRADNLRVFLMQLSFGTFSWLENITFNVIYFFHKIISPFPVSQKYPEYKGSDLQKNSDKIELTSTNYSSPNNELQLKLIAAPRINSFEHLRGYSSCSKPDFGWNFTLTLVKNSTCIGNIELRRSWEDNSLSSISETEYPLSKKPLLNPTFHVRVRRATIDLNLHYLITQLAVEIFNRESAERLTFETKNIIQGPQAMGGFNASINTDKARAKSIREQTLEMRKQGEILFPVHSLFINYWDLGKELNSRDSQTKFYKVDEMGNKELSFVEYAMDNSKTTWEQIIEKQPLIAGKGPILPKFWEPELTNSE